MGKPELPHPKHRAAGTSTPPRSINEASRDENPVEFANQRAREALEQRKTENETPPAPTEELDDAKRAELQALGELEGAQEIERDTSGEPANDDETQQEIAADREAERLEWAGREAEASRLESQRLVDEENQGSPE